MTVNLTSGDNCEQEAYRGEMKVHTYEVVIHSVLDVILRDGVFPVDDLQLSSLLEWVLLKTQQVEDASKGLRGREGIKKRTINSQAAVRNEQTRKQIMK